MLPLFKQSISEACEAVKQIEPNYLVTDKYCADLGAEIRTRFPTIQLITLGYSTEGGIYPVLQELVFALKACYIRNWKSTISYCTHKYTFGP